MSSTAIALYRICTSRLLQGHCGPLRLVALCCTLVLVATAAPGLETRQVFVTSEEGPADISLWPSATLGTVGTGAADSVCQNLASSAGLTRSVFFRSWLSDSLDDAWCRVQGLTGTRDSGCDGAPALAGAGPWARIGDGARWAGTLSAMTDQQGPLVPLDRDENGAEVPDFAGFWTGTDESGRATDRQASALCDDWTSSASASSSVLGSSFETRFAWTNSIGASCDSPRRLVCLETGAGGALPPVATLGPAALAFVTTAVGNGDFASWTGAAGGASTTAADSICVGEAVAAHLFKPQSFVAWASTSARNARDRFPVNLAWRRFDGTGVATSLTDLLDGRLAAPINQTSAAAYLPLPPAEHAPFWTGTTYNGLALAGATCLDWTSTSANDTGLVGFANSAAAGWTDGQEIPCDAILPIACFSTVEILFWGNFESGDLEDWSPQP